MNNKGFVQAGELKVGDELVDVNNNILLIKDYTVEITEEPTTVYNFQVEDFHTYHVGSFGILVHNANYIGANGTQTPSETVWRNGKTERIDVENPAPGYRNGNIHYHDAKNKPYYYDINNKVFFDLKTGATAPKSVQNLLKDNKFFNGIKKALKYLGE